MSQNTVVENKINAYLAAVRAYLGALSPEEIDEILGSIRGHIDSELQQLSDGQPTLEHIDAVLTGMDPPQSYAESASNLADETPPPARFARQAIIGALFLPFGIVMALMLFVIVPGDGSTTVWQWLARFTILPLGILAPFVCTILGFMGITAIRQSQGRLIGLPLAILVGLFYPVIILDALLFALTLWLFEGATYLNVALVVAILLILLVDYFIIRMTWQAAARPQHAG